MNSSKTRDARGGRSTSARMSASNTLRKVREYRLGEEIANSVSHGIGALAAIAAIVLLCFAAANSTHDPLWAWFSALVYGITMLVEYLMSTLYHALTHEKAKRIFKVLDHSGIYLFIAGSYTPFCLLILPDVGGGYLCLFVWALALAGIGAEAFWVFRPRWLSALLYLLMGWCVVWFVIPLSERIAPVGLYLLCAGGLCYSAGCLFYILKKIPYMHSIFHVWVLAGSVCQFIAIWLFVL